MADISKINPNGTEYDIKDAVARGMVEAAKIDLTAIAEKTDTDPYIYRPSVANGDRVRENIVGASVGWNQLATFASSIPSAADGITYTASESNSVILSGTVSNTSQRSGWFNLDESSEFANRVGHKVLFFSRAISGTASKAIKIDLFVSTTPQHNVGDAFIKEVPQNYRRLYWSYESGCVFSNYRITFNCIDLTLMFGTTIADHIYSLEQATVGAGVAFFRKYFTASYYPYNAGELLSVEVEGKKYVGKNLVEESFTGNIGGTGAIWEDTSYSMHVARIIQGKTYTITTDDGAGAVYGFYTDKPQIGSTSYDSVRVVSNNKTFTAPINGYIAFRSNLGYSTPQCELGNTATTYEPYHATPYTFPSQTLRGLFTLVDGELKASGDVYREDGVVTRKYGIVDLGTLNWSYESTNQILYCASDIGEKRTNGRTVVCSKYTSVPNVSGGASMTMDKTICVVNDGSGSVHRIYVKDTAYTSGSAFKTAMNGVYLVYELATPTTEQAEPLVMPQICDKNGTEEFITTSIVPVGHESTYYNYPDYMESGEYKDFRDRVDYAPEKAKWKKVGEYNSGDLVTIDGEWSEILLTTYISINNGYSMSVVYPFALFGVASLTAFNEANGEITLNSTLLDTKYVRMTGLSGAKMHVYVR